MTEPRYNEVVAKTDNQPTPEENADRFVWGPGDIVIVSSGDSAPEAPGERDILGRPIQKKGRGVRAIDPEAQLALVDTADGTALFNLHTGATVAVHADYDTTGWSEPSAADEAWVMEEIVKAAGRRRRARGDA